MENVINIVQTLGFPIACVCALFWFVVRLEDSHKSEMSAVTEALNNNTQALIRLEQKLEDKKNEN